MSLRGLPCRTRLPFRFGVVTLTEAPVLTARVEARVEGHEVEGYSGDLAVPRWFDKTPGSTPTRDIAALAQSAERAAAAFSGRSGSAFELWRSAYRSCVEERPAGSVRLVDGFGVALIERATIDAACRGSGRSFREALVDGSLGFEPGALLSDTRDIDPAAVPASPAPKRVQVRHTVGGVDALRTDDVPAEWRGDDGHPVALAEDIERYGLRAFKLKCGGDADGDARRLEEIARVVAEAGVDAPLYTLDANEQYPELDALGALLDRLDQTDDGRRILAGLRYVEQPLPRERTFEPHSADGVRAIAKSVPLLIDEADDSIDAFERALALGYRGVSVKNCKGVFRALANRALCLARGDGAFQTSEDLTNLPVLPLQQDLATVAVLGLEHSERNGHHFFAGLDGVPKDEAEAALAARPDLYERRGDRIVLKIRNGELSLDCQNEIGFGCASAIDFDPREPIETFANPAPEPEI